LLRTLTVLSGSAGALLVMAAVLVIAEKLITA